MPGGHPPPGACPGRAVPEPKRKRGSHGIRPLRLLILASLVALALASPPALAHSPGLTVEGRVSTFGYLTGDSEGETADGGTTRRPCIALRDDRTLDHWFRVTILGHTARLLQCDWGPAAWTGRAIDVTGLAAEALSFSPTAFPTGAWGVARELP